ncbi:nucleotidyltransferase domain-containing protein [Kineococcus auxinigenes]|uniref:nucleotidyltransferase domain-containing protein n=1 Tax=unclassified Kineococcus TaxID=2621656 RepID=UPI003D7D3FCF
MDATNPLRSIAPTVDADVLHTLDRDHVLAGAVLAAVLLGSRARGEAGSDGDLDLLLVRDDGVDLDGPWGEQVHHLGEEVEALTGNAVQFVQVTRSQLSTAAREGQPLLAGLRADGRVLVGPGLRMLLTEVGRA